uniref:Uncharacterized protein n=1 Tax=Arundo donax TaxID=35708 RepID=A0A0A9BDI4_ARUDO
MGQLRSGQAEEHSSSWSRHSEVPRHPDEDALAHPETLFEALQSLPCK